MGRLAPLACRRREGEQGSCWGTGRPFPKQLNAGVTAGPSNCTPERTPKRTEAKHPQKYPNDRDGLFHESQKVETSHMSISGARDEQNAVCPHDGVSPSHKEP